ncbi:MAG TPA: hypothetical protein VFY18_02425 [Candidatus Limnocylindrales bacterium]|nr:hypothetical protein [Candidatus Limnocylindrales bacterium]
MLRRDRSGRGSSASIRSVAGALLIAAASLLMSAQTATAADADAGSDGADFAPVGTLVPPTVAEQKIIDLKLAVARDEERRMRSGMRGASVAACPNIAPAFAGVKGSTQNRSVTPENLVCLPYYAYLTTYYRHQTKNYFCGPASVQVVANYAWKMASGSNKYTQQYISDHWTATDANGQTDISHEKVGLNSATDGHRPSNFIYSYYLLSGTQVAAGRDWHNKLRTDVGSYQMPQVENVAPHDAGATYHLVSWPSVHDGAGHYVVADGWDTVWDGTYANSQPTTTYDDGSAGYGGGDGHYTDPARTVFYTVWTHHKYILW